ncbi:hypothetical protein DV737_g3365, partial [Chaetothyriales sp. CBS 132003]
MPAGSHEMGEHYYYDQDQSRTTPHTVPSITPYLGLRARLSQVPINRWTVLLLLVLARTLIAISSMKSDLSSARREALSACSDVESIGSTIASMPHYMSQGVNELTAKGVEKAVDGLMAVTTMSVTATEEIAVFVWNMMTSTYLCLITYGIHGALDGVSSVLNSSQADINALTKSVTGEISDAIGSFGTAYDDLVEAVDSISAFGKTVDIPTLPNLTDQQNALTSFKLPANLSGPFVELNQTIPDFAGVKNLTDQVIRFPFEEVKSLVSNFSGNYTFNRDLFPVPAKVQLTFCSDSDGINDFFNHLDQLMDLGKKVFVAVLVCLAIAAMFPMGWREIKRYRKMQARMPLVMTAAYDPMDATYLVARPYTSSVGLWLSRTPLYRVPNATRNQTLIRWAVAYCTSDAALFVLTLALAGFFSCLCQIILLRAVQTKIPALSNEVGAFADKVISNLNNASNSWQQGVSAALEHESDIINGQLLGWVNTSAHTINNTINTFVNATSTVLNDTFGGTPLYTPIMDVLNCLVLLKVQGIQTGLTWISDNAHVDFPSLPNDTFTIGALASLSSNASAGDSFLSDPGDQASDKITEVVVRFTSALEQTIRTEALVATVIFCVWLAVVCIGFGYAFMKMTRRHRTRGEGGTPPMQQLDRGVAPTRPTHPTSMSSRACSDFTSDNQDRFVDIPLGHVSNSGRHVDPTASPPALPAYKEREHSPVRAGQTDEKDQFGDGVGDIGADQGGYNPPQFVIDAAKGALDRVDCNQYSPTKGRPRLKKAIADAYSPFFGRKLDPDTEVTITTGANEGMLSAFMGFIEPGDEVIVFEPFFDQYLSNIEMPGGTIRYVPMLPPKDGATRTSSASNWTIDWDALEKTFNDKTKMIVINSPHNPVGKVLSKEELRRIGDLCLKHKVLILSDEVYDRLYYVPFTRMATLSPELAKITLTVGSAGKNFYATGWRVGYLIGPAELIKYVAAAHTRICYSSVSPLQEAAAIAFEQADQEGFWDTQISEMRGKIQRFCAVFDELDIPYSIPEGGYFVLANLAKVKLPEGYAFPDHVKDRPRDFKMAWFLIMELGVAAIPPTEFYTDANAPLAEDYMRFAVCKTDDVLETAKERLRGLSKYFDK